MSDSRTKAAEMEEEACECSYETGGAALEPADELEWLREQYVVLKQNNDSLRAAYSAAGQEASALRRALVSRAPTLRERAALAALPVFLEEAVAAISAAAELGGAVEYDDYIDAAAMRAQLAADALVARLTNG